MTWIANDQNSALSRHLPQVVRASVDLEVKSGSVQSFCERVKAAELVPFEAEEFRSSGDADGIGLSMSRQSTGRPRPLEVVARECVIFLDAESIASEF